MNLLILPVLVPLLSAAVCLIGWRSVRFQRVVAVLGSGAHLAVCVTLLRAVRSEGIQVLRFGDWASPFGIAFAADLFGAIMAVLAGIIGFSVMIYSLATIDRTRESFGYYPLFLVLLAGVSGAFLTGDIFNLYVWFEVLLMSSFVLISLGNEKAQTEGSIKYVVLNLISSALFLTAAGLLYGIAGTLNYADLSNVLSQHPRPALVLSIGMLFFTAFGIKAAVFPLFFWLPASYHTPPAAVSAVLSGLLTKVGVYAMIRAFTLLFDGTSPGVQQLVLVVSGLTMITGVLGAIAQNEMRRILSFHIVSQIGYMIMGLGIHTPLALAGSVFYIAHHILVKTNLFLVAGIVHHSRGTYQLKPLGGLYRSRPFLALLFAVPAFSLAGIPPLSGFFAKFALARAGLETSHFWIVGVALGCGLLTLFSMTKIWNEVFWKASAEPGGPGRPSGAALILPSAALAAMTVLIGVSAGPLFDLSMDAAAQLLNRADYVQAVLGGTVR